MPQAAFPASAAGASSSFIQVSTFPFHFKRLSLEIEIPQEMHGGWFKLIHKRQ